MSDNGRVALTVPASGEYARTVRLTAGELASRVGMTIDDVDDMKLGVEEAFVYACNHAKGGELVFTFVLSSSNIEVTVGPLVGADAAHTDETDERYARFILESICDEFEVLDRDGEQSLRLAKSV